MKKYLTIVLLSIAGLAFAADAFQVKVEWFGVAIPGRLILMESATGRVKWSGGTPTEQGQIDFWDQVVLTRNAVVSLEDYALSDAMTDWNAMRLELATDGKLSGDPEAGAKRLWRTLKRLFPNSFL